MGRPAVAPCYLTGAAAGIHDTIPGEIMLTTCKPYLSLQELRSAGCNNFATSLLAVIIIPSRERDDTVH